MIKLLLLNNNKDLFIEGHGSTKKFQSPQGRWKEAKAASFPAAEQYRVTIPQYAYPTVSHLFSPYF
jgi:hypothetical protein